jgi:hypothetical protein
MISLGGLVSQKAFGKFEMGKVISNPFANAFIKEGEGEDHEVSMANNSIDIIIKMATELKAKMGEDEKQIPAWIQDHIAKAENLISQASGNYHEYGDSNESVNETVSDKKVDAKVIANKMRKNQSTKAFANKVEKMGKVSHKDLEKILPDYVSGGLITNLFKESIKEASPCWNGYKQVGMKDKGGKQVPNCVPEGKVNEEIKEKDWKTIYNVFVKFLKANTKALEIRVMMRDEAATKKAIESIISGLTNAQRSLKLESVNEAPNTGEKIQNLNNRIKVLRDKISATKSPEQKKLHSDRLKNALQSLSNIKKDFGIKKEASGRVPQIFLKTGAVEKKIKELMADRKKAVVPYNSEKDPTKKESLKQILIKLTKQIQGYEKNLIQLRDKEEEYIQQMNADAQLDVSAID